MKVFVTGLGVVSGIGVGVDENVASLRAGRSGMGQVTLFPTALDVPVSEVKYNNKALQEFLELDSNCTYSRTALLALLAAKEAWDDAQCASLEEEEEEFITGIISATSVGGMDLSEHFYEAFKENPRKGRLRHIVSHDCAASTKLIASYLSIKGQTTTISTACSSAANAIMQGAELIRTGKLDTVIVGGTDALCRFTLNGFNSLMILDKEHCRPFDESRTGLNLGEGAGYLVLQSEKACRKIPYCELTGYANVNEAYHQTGSSAEGDGAFRCMNEAIAMSGITPKEVSYVSVHGTGTPNNDVSESRALQRIFGEHLPPFSSVKPFIGHTLGASGGIEAVYSVLSIHHGCTYPNLNFCQPIAATGLVPESSFREGLPIKHVVCNSFGFGGNDSSLVFSAVNPAKQKKCANKKAASTHVYINAFSSIHAEGAKEGSEHLSAQEPDYKSIITDANQRRRMSRIVKMGVACGLNCIGTTPAEKIQGIITATGWGCLTDTEKFLNAIIDQKEQSLNPTPFIQSTFNTIGAQIAILRQIQAYNVTYVHRGTSFENALNDGIAKIEEGKENILVGAVDEWTPTSHTIQQRLGVLRGVRAGEGAQFFLLSNQPTDTTVAEVYSALNTSLPTEELSLMLEEWGDGTIKLPNLSLTALAVIVLGLVTGSGLRIGDVDWYVTGESGNTKQDKLYTEMHEKYFPHVAHSSFKDECGEYPTASSYALWKVVTAFKDPNHPAKVALIHNCYQPGMHSLILVKKHQS